jgi:uncharacterized SAM-binding protein YcdF (DUF218 family)
MGYLIMGIQVFLLPAGLVLVLSVLSVLFLRRRKKVAAVFGIAAAALLYLFSIEPVRDLILIPLENRYPPLSRDIPLENERVVILGGGTIPRSPEYDGASLSPGAYKRTVYGGILARRHGLEVLTTGGTVLPGKIETPEATAAERLLVETGLPRKRISTETRSTDTWENALYAREKTGGGKIVLVTSAYHMPRAIRSFQANGFCVIPAPTDYRGNRHGYTFLSFLPDASVFEESSLGIHEYLGILYYRLRYY